MREMTAITTEISTQEIDFHPTSFCDQDGRVFWWKGELYRGISSGYAPFCRRLFTTGVVRSLIQQGFLIDTELTNHTLPGYALVLKHRHLRFVSYANEWCPAMLRAAAQFTLDMMRSLARHNLTVDVGTWDILFEGCEPRYVDFCSIAAAETYDCHSWNGALDDFYSYFVNPLRLMSQGKGKMARWLLADYEHRAIHTELAAMMGQQIYGRRTALNGRIQRMWAAIARRHPCRLDLVAKMQRSLDRIPLDPISLDPISLDPISLHRVALDKPNSADSRLYSVHRVLSARRPATVLDMGCGEGRYARLAASLGAQVVAIDNDDRQVNECYQKAKAKGLSVLPLVMDIRYPSAGQGVEKLAIAPAIQRLSCELVLALDLLHLLIFEQHFTLSQAVDALAAFSTRWLLVEFSGGDGNRAQPELSSAYRLNALLTLLGRHFQKVEMVSVQTGKSSLILCER